MSASKQLASIEREETPQISRELLEKYEKVDPIMFQVVGNGLVSICREMGTTMVRTAYSPIFADGMDFSCAIIMRMLNYSPIRS